MMAILFMMVKITLLHINDTIRSQGRIRFTLMHEIAHILLTHLIDFNETILIRNALTKSKYKILENESNAFARNVLIPAI